MIVECPSCHSRFTVPDALLGTEGRTVRCSKCKHAWHQSPPVTAPEDATAHAATATETTPEAPLPEPRMASLSDADIEAIFAGVALDPAPAQAVRSPAVVVIDEELPRMELPDFSSEASQAMDALDRPDAMEMPGEQVLTASPSEATAEDHTSEEDETNSDALTDHLPIEHDDEAREHLSHLQPPQEKRNHAAAPTARGPAAPLKIAAITSWAAASVLIALVAREPLGHAMPWLTPILNSMGAAPAQGLMFSDVAFERTPSDRGSRVTIGCAVRNMSNESRALPNMRLKLYNRGGTVIVEEDHLLAPIAQVAAGDMVPCDIPAMELRSGTAHEFVLDLGSTMDILTRAEP